MLRLFILSDSHTFLIHIRFISLGDVITNVHISFIIFAGTL